MSAQTTIRVEKKDKTVSVLLLKLQSMELLIPKIMVVDVLSWNDSDRISSASYDAEWKLGEYGWKEEYIPLVCYEKLVGTEHCEDRMLKRKVVVIRSSQQPDQHYALHCKGFPKPLILTESSLNELSKKSDNYWLTHSMSIGSRILDIPDFTKLENSIWPQETKVSGTA